MQISCKALTRLMVAALKAHVASGTFSGPLYQPWIGLYIAATPSPSPDSVLANFTEASFAGYARQQITAWTGPFDDQGSQSEILGPLLEFSPTDALLPQTVLGLIWCDAVTAGNLLGVDMFAESVPLAGPTDALSVVPRAALLFVGDYGDAVVVP